MNNEITKSFLIESNLCVYLHLFQFLVLLSHTESKESVSLTQNKFYKSSMTKILIIFRHLNKSNRQKSTKHSILMHFSSKNKLLQQNYFLIYKV
jgi:hypothetical protein